jgi:uncharacterized membrane protein
MAHEEHENLDERMLHRMLFFTDAVFAIVLTLLVLELKPPETRLAANLDTLRHAAPHIAAFAFSFLIVSIFWATHMTTVRRLAAFDWPIAVANLTYLLPISFLPFATGWLGIDINGAVTWALYSSVLVAISACNVVIVLLAFRDGGRLIAGGATARERAFRLTRAASPGIAFGVGLLMLAMGLTIPAHFCWILIPLIGRVARLLFGPRRPPAPAAETEAA